MNRSIVATVIALSGVTVAAVAVASTPADAPVESYIVQPGDGFYAIADEIAPGADRDVAAEYLARANGNTLGDVIHEGRVLWYAPSASELAATTTTTTIAPTTTTTIAPTTTTTAPPTTTTTIAPTTTTTVAPTTTTTPPSAGFVATFDGDTGLEAFDMGVYHRNRDVQGGGSTPDSWTGDHDLSCGSPDTQRTLFYDPSQTQAERVAESIYLCRDHMMTSMGDVDGYSIVWLTPDQTFTGGEVTSVSWDVNVTDLKARQWWEVALIPDGDPHLATIPLVAGAANIDPYSLGSVAIGNGPFGGDKPSIYADQTQHYSSGRKWCQSGVWSRAGDGTGGAFDACDDKAERVPFTLTDNLDGTLTIVWGDDEQGTVERYEQTFPGSFPDAFHVYFKDHNYTPDKGGAPVGYTWHWDNIIIR